MNRGLLGRREVGLAIAIIAAVGASARLRFDEPPRYDGAGYALLARSLAAGSGYRDVSDPEAPPHAHFPPLYPLALAGVFRATGGSLPWGRALSVACTAGAAWLAWRAWLDAAGPAVAAPLGLALSCNWTWARIGGSIQSEPLYLALSGLAVAMAARPGGARRPAALGAVAGLCLLTRHVGACVALAIGVDLWLGGRRRGLLKFGVAAGVVVAPWAGWLMWAGRDTQAGLFRGGSLPGLVASQVVFYGRRIPDQLFGPFVEVATVFGRSRAVAAGATAGAMAFSAVAIYGLVRLARDPDRRIWGLMPLLTLSLLVAWPFTEAGRFLVPLVPSLLLGSAEGFAAISGRSRAAIAAALLVGSIPYAAYALISDREGGRVATHAGFDAACRWIAAEGGRPGPILARHPADVAWQAGRNSIGAATEAEVEAAVDRRGVAYLLVDDARYAGAPAGPIGAYARRRPDRARLVWGGGGEVRVYEVIPPR